jgi:uncharacterized protein (TIGR03118 family)
LNGRKIVRQPEASFLRAILRSHHARLSQNTTEEAMNGQFSRRLAGLVGAALAIAGGVAYGSPIGYVQTNLTSDVPGLAANTDPDLKNPWGMSYGTSTPFWISDQATNIATLYNGAGVKQGLVVTMPAGLGPTGQVFVSGLGFSTGTGANSLFVFSTLSGQIDAWNGGTSAVVAAEVPGAVYTGLAVAGSRLYAANTAAGRIDVFDNNFSLTSGASFVDPGLPAGFAPYNIQNIGGKLYVEYAKEGSPGGLIGVFDADGNFLQQITDAHFDEPWGVALAPAGFGDFANDLLVGNFGDGTINAFDPLSGLFIGTLSDAAGNPIVNDGLWALGFRTGPAFDNNALFFTAGIHNEADGLFGEITVVGAAPTTVPEPMTFTLLGLGIAALASRKARS